MAGGVLSSLNDLKTMGLGFWWGGLRAQFGRPGLMQVPVPGIGKVLVRARDSDMSVLRQVVRDRSYAMPGGSYQERAGQICRDIVGAGRTPVIVDAGANIGAASLWFLNEYPRAHVIAVEPEAKTVEVLRLNLGARAEVLEAALGGATGCVSTVATGKSWGTQTVRSQTGLPIVTIDDLVRSVPNGVLFIAKIDIEGFEDDVFGGDCAWLDDVPIVIIEPHDWLRSGTSASFQAALGRRDFDLLIQGENLIYFNRKPLMV